MSTSEAHDDSKDLDGPVVMVVEDHDTSNVPQLYGGNSIIPMWKFYVCLTGLLLLYICNTGSLQSMNVSIGFIARDLLFERSQVGWIQSAFGLTAGCLLLLYVSLCNKYGPRIVLIGCGIAYTAFTAACAASQTPTQLIAFRALQGAATTGTIPAGWDIIMQLLPPHSDPAFRSVIFAIYASGAPLGSASGTLIGGLATQYSAITWRGVYTVYACLGALGTIMGAVFCPPSVVFDIPGGIDYLGTALISASLTLIFFCLSQGPNVGWNTPYIIGLIVIGCVMLPVFVLYEIWLERKGRTPMIHMKMFTFPRVGAFHLFGFFGFGAFVTWDYWAGQYYVNVKGLDAVGVMLRYLPQALGGFIGVPTATYLSRKVPINFIFSFGVLFAMLGSLIFAVSKDSQSYWSSGQFLGFFFSITGATWLFNSGSQFCVAIVTPVEAKTSSGLFQIWTNLSSPFGVIISTLVGDKYASIDDPTSVYKYAFWTCAAFGIFATIGAFPLTWGAGKIVEIEAAHKLSQEEQLGQPMAPLGGH